MQASIPAFLLAAVTTVSLAQDNPQIPSSPTTTSPFATSNTFSIQSVQPPTTLTVSGPPNSDGTPNMLVSIRLSDGLVTFGPGYTPDAASRVFWQSMAASIPRCTP